MSKVQTRPRTLARVAAVQALFQADQTGDSNETVLSEFQRHRLTAAEGEDDGKLPLADADLFARIVRAAGTKAGVIDAHLRATLPGDWPLERLDAVLRSLLRAGVGELLAGDAPARVIINEYLDVAAGFFSGDEPRLINGVLDKLGHQLRPGDFG